MDPIKATVAHAVVPVSVVGGYLLLAFATFAQHFLVVLHMERPHSAFHTFWTYGF